MTPCPITADRDEWRGAVTDVDKQAGIAADEGAIGVARALSDRSFGASQSEMRAARQDYLAEAFARYRIAGEKAHRETLAVLQIAHESELAMQARIDALVQALGKLCEHSAPIGPVGDAARSEALEAIAKAKGGAA